MKLTDIIGHKTRTFALGAALLSCGDEKPPVTYIINTPEDKANYCEQACERFYDCSPKTNSTEAKCVDDCTKVASDSWLNCMLEEVCDEYLASTCEDSK